MAASKGDTRVVEVGEVEGDSENKRRLLELMEEVRGRERREQERRTSRPLMRLKSMCINCGSWWYYDGVENQLPDRECPRFRCVGTAWGAPQPVQTIKLEKPVLFSNFINFNEEEEEDPKYDPPPKLPAVGNGPLIPVRPLITRSKRRFRFPDKRSAEIKEAAVDLRGRLRTIKTDCDNGVYVKNEIRWLLALAVDLLSRQGYIK